MRCQLLMSTRVMLTHSSLDEPANRQNARHRILRRGYKRVMSGEHHDQAVVTHLTAYLLRKGHAAQIRQGCSEAAVRGDDDVHIIRQQGQGLSSSQHLHSKQNRAVADVSNARSTRISSMQRLCRAISSALHASEMQRCWRFPGSRPTTKGCHTPTLDCV